MIRYIALFCLLASLAVAQGTRPHGPGNRGEGKNFPRRAPIVMRDYPVYLGNNQFRLYFPVEIQYDFLQFIRQENGYRAGAEMEVILQDPKARVLKNIIWKTQAHTATFDSTNRPDVYHLSLDSLDIGAGAYTVLFKYRDLNGQQRLNRKIKIRLEARDNRYISPPLFLYPRNEGPAYLQFLEHRPSATREVWPFASDLSLYLNLYISGAEGTHRARATVLPAAGEHREAISGETELIPYPNGYHGVISLPTRYLPEGVHKLKIDYFLGKDSISQNVSLKMVWFEKPFSLRNFRTALDVLQYVLDKEAYKDLTRGSNEEKRLSFNQYWKKLDPTPDTPYNELMAEFYSRVDSANVRWSDRRTPGWKTDIGKIYILYGTPDQVDDHSLDPIPRPYMKWIYRKPEKEIVVTFLALQGRKEYKLSGVEEKPLN